LLSAFVILQVFSARFYFLGICLVAEMKCLLLFFSHLYCFIFCYDMS
jgi:hypothetical protein